MTLAPGRTAMGCRTATETAFRRRWFAVSPWLALVLSLSGAAYHKAYAVEQAKVRGAARRGPVAQAAPEEPRRWDAARVRGLLDTLRDAPAPQRPTVRPAAAEALKSYAKAWQGSREEQVRLETAYRELAEIVAVAFPESDEARLAKGVRARARLRLRYLRAPKALAADVEQAWHVLLTQDYERCSRLCRTLLDAAYDRSPAVELAVGVCEMQAADSESALRRFREVLDLKRSGESRIAAVAAFLAAHTLVRCGKPQDALRMLRALQKDYPGTKLAERASGMAARLNAMVKALAETNKAPDPAAPRPTATYEERREIATTSLDVLTELLKDEFPSAPVVPQGRERP